MLGEGVSDPHTCISVFCSIVHTVLERGSPGLEAVGGKDPSIPGSQVLATAQVWDEDT